MPNPKKGEGKQDYLKRCTKELIETEGKSAKQAYAHCNSYWKEARGLSDDDDYYELNAEFAQPAAKDELLITAHVGKILSNFWENFIININGIKFNDKLPYLEEHFSKLRIGFGKGWIEDNTLYSRGHWLTNETALKLKKDMEEGFPMQASIGVWPLEVQELKKGMKKKINGMEVEGPLIIWNKSHVREISLTTLGADDSTAAITMNKNLNQNTGDDKMATENPGQGTENPGQGNENLGQENEKSGKFFTAFEDFKKSLEVKLEGIEKKLSERPEKTEKHEPGDTQRDVYDLMVSLCVEKANLPEPVSSRLEKKFLSGTYTKKQIDDEILDAKDLVDKLLPSDMELSIKVEGSELENGAKMLSDIFDRKAHSIKRAYVKMTGDTEITGRLNSTNAMKLSITTTQWTNALANEMNKVLIRAYTQPERMKWKEICNIAPANDFRAHTFKAIGGYGTLPTVAEKGPYLPLTSPGDQSASITVFKKGGTEDFSIEAIKNDDVEAVRRIPLTLGNLAIVSLSEFVFNTLIAGNPDFDFDSTAIFHADHNNTGTTALGEASLSAGRLAIVKQTELSSGKRLGAVPKYLLVPPDLTKTAFELTNFASSTYTVPAASGVHSGAFNRSFGLNLLEIIDFTDANNWYLFADPTMYPGLQLIFLDGKEEPEMFIQDMPAVGSMFTHDAITWKLKHVYGGDWVDFRSAYGGIVA